MKDDHGRASTYSNWGCRCDACCAANTARHRAWVERRRGQEIPDFVQHGQEGTYNNWGCRCDECYLAHSLRMERYKRLRRIREAAET